MVMVSVIMFRFAHFNRFGGFVLVVSVVSLIWFWSFRLSGFISLFCVLVPAVNSYPVPILHFDYLSKIRGGPQGWSMDPGPCFVYVLSARRT